METFLERIANFFEKIGLILFKNNEEDEEENEEYTTSLDIVEDNFEEDKIFIKNRTLLKKLYSLEQQITVLEKYFPDEYSSFMSKIEAFRNEYVASYEESQKKLTFEVDPDFDINKGNEIYRLEHKIREFIDVKLKFKIISEKLQSLIVKINILYNTSIYHTSDEEKVKVISQLSHARVSLCSCIQELKNCDYVLNNKPSRERILDLISYADYLIFRCYIKNSKCDIVKLEEELALKHEFEVFDYKSIFSDYVKDEISDFKLLTSLITIPGGYKMLDTRIYNLQKEMAYKNSDYVFNLEFWDKYLLVESQLINILMASGVGKDKAKLGILQKMNIQTKENDVVTSPWVFANLCLAEIYQVTSSKNILLVIKLLSVLSEDVTYKEIYFLLVLFEAIDVVQTFSTGLSKKLEKYIEKYPYSKIDILKKKDKVKRLENKVFLKTFLVQNYELQDISLSLDNLMFDYKVKDNYIYFNSYYFGTLQNVLNSLNNIN